MSEDWGCDVSMFGEPSSSEKPSKSLTELVEILSKKNKNGSKQNVQTPSEAENVKVVTHQRSGSFSSMSKIAKIHAPKILKKKKNNNNNTVLNESSAKRVHFEIEQLLAREASKEDREKARERMLTNLGAAPAKREFVNYKDLKVDRAAQKAEAKVQAEMHHANSLSLTTLKKKKKKK